MSMNRIALLLAGVVLAVIVWWVASRPGPEAEPIDLIARYGEAEKRSSLPTGQAFGVAEVDIAGERRRSILMHPTSRLTFRVRLPEDAWLRTWLGIRPEAWERTTDGVLFRFGVSDGRNYDELITYHVDPRHNPGDRAWIPLTVDLAPYGGEDVELIFNTNSSPPGAGDDASYDWAVWAAPEVYVEP